MTSEVASARDFTTALKQRLRYLASVAPESLGVNDSDIGQLLADLKAISDPEQRRARLWLLLATVIVNYPTTAEFCRIERLVRRGEIYQAAGELLEFALASPADRLLSDVQLIDDEPVVITEEFSETFLIPNQTEALLPSSDVTSFDFADRLSCLARFSGSGLTVFHRFDLLNSPQAPIVFAALKHAGRVFVEDQQSARELRALFSTLPNQGLPVPEVTVREGAVSSNE